MFGIGFGELLLILLVVLLFIGPDKLPQTAKSISKGIRAIRGQTKQIRDSLEQDEEIGGAIRDLRSAMRGDPLPPAGMPIPGQHNQNKPPQLEDESVRECSDEDGDGGGDAKAAASSGDDTNTEVGAAETDNNDDDTADKDKLPFTLAAADGVVAREDVVEADDRDESS